MILGPVRETTDELADEMIDKLANLIRRYGMEVPAVFFLEMGKPVSFLAGSTVHMASPTIGFFLGMEDQFSDFGNILSDRKKLERLICRIEELAKEKPH